MDSNHIAIITLLDKTEELQDHKRILETEKQELEQRIKQAASQISDLRTAVNLLQTGLKQLSNAQQPLIDRAETAYSKAPSIAEKHTNPDAYPINGTLRDKVLYILHEQSRFLHSREIAEYIIAYEPEKNVEKVLELISKQVARYKKNKVITSVMDDTGRHNYYGLPEWLDDRKRPVRGYEYTYKLTKNSNES